jgi:hypothetical protein
MKQDQEIPPTYMTMEIKMTHTDTGTTRATPRAKAIKAISSTATKKAAAETVRAAKKAEKIAGFQRLVDYLVKVKADKEASAVPSIL